MSTKFIAAIQSPEHKRCKSGKKSTKESVRRQLHLALEAATSRKSSPTPTLNQKAYFDSLDCAMQHMDKIIKANISKHQLSPTSNHIIPDPPESQYIASPQSHKKIDKNAPSSLGPDLPS